MLRRSLVVLVLLLVSLPLPQAAAGGCHSEAPADASGSDGDATVHISRCAFDPTVLFIDVGSTVAWVNHDPVPHNVTGVAGSFFPDVMLENEDRTPAMTFDQPGVYPYSCTIHPGMVGAIVVGDVETLRSDADADDAEARSAARPDGPSDGGSGPSPYISVLGIGALLFGVATVARRRGDRAFGPDEGTAAGP